MKLLLSLLFAASAFGQSLASQDCHIKQFHYPEGLYSECIFVVSQPSTLSKIFLFRKTVTAVTISFADGTPDWTIGPGPDPNQFSLTSSNPNRNIAAVTISGKKYPTVYK